MDTSTSANELVNSADDKLQDQNNLTLKASPNPSTSYFNITINSSNLTDHVNIVIVDEVGRAMETRTASAGQTLRVGDGYHAGVYFVQALQGNKRVTLKLIKQAW